MEPDKVEPDKTVDAQRHVIAVLRTPQIARQVVAELKANGISDRQVRVDDPRDEEPALRAEMRAEIADAVVLPQASFIADKEGARGFFITFLSLSGAAVVVALLVALIDWGMNYWERFVVAVAIGVGLALAIALVFGLAWGSSDPNRPAAALRGTVVRVGVDNDTVRRILTAADPIRVDEITAAGNPAATVWTEEQRGGEHVSGKTRHTIEHMREQADKPQ
jgi:hypothetical protein